MSFNRDVFGKLSLSCPSIVFSCFHNVSQRRAILNFDKIQCVLFCLLKWNLYCLWKWRSYPLTQSYKDFLLCSLLKLSWSWVWLLALWCTWMISHTGSKIWFIFCKFLFAPVPLVKVDPSLHWLAAARLLEIVICLIFHLFLSLDSCYPDLCADAVLITAAG